MFRPELNQPISPERTREEMNIFYLLILLTGNLLWAQSDYFSVENKKKGLKYFEQQIHKGCTSYKSERVPITPEEMKSLTTIASDMVSKRFSKAFKESPKVKEHYLKDIQELSREKLCQLKNNHCRIKILAISMYYYNLLRPDIPNCMNSELSEECRIEKKFRQSSLQGVYNGSYGLAPVGIYKKILLKIKNDTTLDIFNEIMMDTKGDVLICDKVKTGDQYNYNFETKEPGKYFKDLDPDYDIRNNLTKACQEKKIKLHSDFEVLDFDSDRLTLGESQVLPVKEIVKEFVISHPEMVVTDIAIVASSSRAPLYKSVAGKKVIDPESDKRNLSLAEERSRFANKVFSDLKNENFNFKNIRFRHKAELAGPEFSPVDFNSRFITRLTPGYLQKVEALYNEFEKRFNVQAITHSYQDLIDEKKYPNLFLAKFKPFHGFRIIFIGFKKNEMKCLNETKSKSKSKAKSIRQ
jgi:hypothetical protein